MILLETFTGNLVSAPISIERTFNYDVMLRGVEIVASTEITESIIVIHKTSDAEFTKDAKVLSSETDYSYHPVGDVIIKRGNAIKVTVSNANTTGTIQGLITVEAL